MLEMFKVYAPSHQVPRGQGLGLSTKSSTKMDVKLSTKEMSPQTLFGSP